MKHIELTYLPVSIVVATIILALVALIGINTYSLAYNTQVTQANKNQAVDGCLKSSLYRNVTANGKVTTTTEEALASSVDKCLQLKGY